MLAAYSLPGKQATALPLKRFAHRQTQSDNEANQHFRLGNFPRFRYEEEHAADGLRVDDRLCRERDSECVRGSEGQGWKERANIKGLCIVPRERA